MRKILVLGLTALLISGCSHYEPPALHGAASMRVDVEVYKGPLTASVPGQIGQLAGVLSNSIHAAYDWRLKAMGVGCAPNSTDGDCAALVSAINTSEDVIGAGCYMISTPTFQALAGRAVYVPIGTCREFRRQSSAGVYPARPSLASDSAESTSHTIASGGNSITTRTTVTHQEFDAGPPRGKQTEDDIVHEMQKNDAGAKATDGAPSSRPTFRAEEVARGGGISAGRAAQLYQLDADLTGCGQNYERDFYSQLQCQANLFGVAFDNYAATLSGAAQRVSDGTVARVPQSDRVRGLLVEYASLTSDYGRQIHARIAVLQKQLDPDWRNVASEDPTPSTHGVDAQTKVQAKLPRAARTLAVSDYLQDAERTDYVQLYDWLRGAETYAGPAIGILSNEERIRMAQRLAADSYWHPVNHVYASGQGEVSMAFVKDDLGNWNLKGFSNDPSELLAAYRKVTDATITTAIKLATKAGTGPVGLAADRLSTAQRAVSVANQFATGEVPGTPGVVGGVDIAKLHERTSEQLAAQKVRFAGLEARLGTESTEQDKVAKAKSKEVDNAKRDLGTQQDNLKTARDKRSNEQQKLINAISAFEEKKKAGPTTQADQDVLDAARKDLTDAQDAVDTQVQVVNAAQATLETATKEKLEADAKKAAADQRLADLPKEAVEAARGTLEDHMAVIASLQQGIAESAAPAARGGTAAAPALPKLP